ncbi:hypothetical protein AJ80_07652 [Polytolypa hystricis UAMH7299]|uniref:FAD-binding domain-containing protein n=1 Tax=Polytolypa hystricis (strain UAMH7299) TaxID=1447883 RepID=A0A2B7XL85_POLH7|nr:hypothetical protein AJ80_07652 [Polytolypa hystricis UAMH7299]
MSISTILILGGGIAGIASALALSKELTPLVPDLKITIYELRDIPSTSGGAINLTPVAQRHLDQLGVIAELDHMGPDAGVEVNAIEYYSTVTGRKLGCVDFAGKHGRGFGGYRGRRCMRIALQLAMMAAVEKCPNVSFEFGKKVVGGIETEKRVTIYFDDGSSAKGDLALGCDGVHSATRTKIVDPERLSEYTGISFIQSTMKASLVTSPMHFETTALNKSRRGALMTTFCDRDKEDLFVAALAEVDAQNLAETHWKSYWADESSRAKVMAVKRLRDDLRGRFGEAMQPCIREIIEKCPDWFLYPVYQIQPGGKWFTERIILLGDAAHAMPPRDESAAYALDDAILFARILSSYVYEPLTSAFRVYESIRRKPIDDAYRDASIHWSQHKDSSSRSGLSARINEWFMPWSMRARAKKAKHGAWVFDARSVNIPSPAARSWKIESWSDLGSTMSVQ